MIFQRALLYNLYEHEEEEEEEEEESELGWSPSLRKEVHLYLPRIWHFKRVDGNKSEKVKKKLRAFIFIARDVFVALTVVVAKASYIHESDRSILVLLQAPINKCGKVSG